jgi:hypothetical protein
VSSTSLGWRSIQELLFGYDQLDRIRSLSGEDLPPFMSASASFHDPSITYSESLRQSISDSYIIRGPYSRETLPSKRYYHAVKTPPSIIKRPWWSCCSFKRRPFRHFQTHLWVTLQLTHQLVGRSIVTTISKVTYTMYTPYYTSPCSMPSPKKLTSVKMVIFLSDFATSQWETKTYHLSN